VVDRYAGYNRSPCAIQYCYAHLLRDLEDLDKEFPDQPEVRGFVQTVRPLLAAAMGLRGLGLSRKAYRRQAADLRRKIKRVMNATAQHLGVRHIKTSSGRTPIVCITGPTTPRCRPRTTWPNENSARWWWHAR
jgi:hypothetical protein